MRVVDILNMSEGFATIDDNQTRPNAPEARKGLIRILIADDHPIVRDGLKKLLCLEEDFEVVGEAADGCEVLDKVQELDPDVLLLDLRMPNLDGLSALQTLQQTNKRTRVIILTASEDKNEFVQAMKLVLGHCTQADRSRIDRQERSEGSWWGNLAGLAHYGRCDATVRGAWREWGFRFRQSTREIPIEPTRARDSPTCRPGI